MTESSKETAQKEKMEGTIEIELVQELPVQTAEMEIAGFKWELCWEKEANRCVICCNEEFVDRLWVCCAKCTFQSKDKKWVEYKEDAQPAGWFNSNNRELHKLVYPSGRPIKATAVKVDIEVLLSAPQSCFPILDAILDVKYGNKSKEFHVNRNILAAYSPAYFGNFFFGDWAEKRKKRATDDGSIEKFDIEEKADLNLSAFGSMLYFMHFSALLHHRQDFLESIPSGAIIDLLILSVKYSFPMLVHYGEQSLIKRGPGTLEQLVVAEAENLSALETIDALEYGKNVMESIELRARLGDETRKLLDKRIEETAERYSRKRKLFVEEDTEIDETSTSRR